MVLVVKYIYTPRSKVLVLAARAAAPGRAGVVGAALCGGVTFPT